MALKKKAAPTIQDRLAAHNAAGVAAVAAFEKAANDLEAAAEGLRESALDAHIEAAALSALGDDAIEAARKNEASAAKIRELFA